MKTTILLFLFVCSFWACESKKNISTLSPDKKIEFTLENSGKDILYSVKFNRKTVLLPSKIEIGLKEKVFSAQNLKIVKTSTKEVTEKWTRVWGKRKEVANQYSELLVEMQETIDLMRKLNFIVRVYNNGVAIRYEIPQQEKVDSILLTSEKFNYVFAGNSPVIAAKWKSFRISQEEEFNKTNLNEINKKQLLGTPVLLNPEKDVWLALMEASVTDWACSSYMLDDSIPNSLKSYPSRRLNDSAYIVHTKDQRLSPWKVIQIAENPGQFIESDILQNLNEPCAIAQTDWIKPGVSSWDWWWSDCYAPKAKFKLGSNTETMKYFIDFSAEMGWQYQLVDWQWYGNPFTPDWKPIMGLDITKHTKDIDIEELVKYAASKNVKIIVWLLWWHADKQLEEAFAQYEKWGVAGVKIDFMDRNDQAMVNFYQRVVKTAAKHHLLVDFHGAYMPDGFSRTYPNLITREGIMGNEYNKWSNKITPKHCVTIPFTRMLGGEMDFTPGGFNQVLPSKFDAKGKNPPSPAVMGTRAFQLAMFVVYESALTVFCESPDNVRGQAGADFLKAIPTTWDETKVLEGVPGEYISIARKSGNTWYIGAMADGKHTFNLNLDFLAKGKHKATIWKDAADSNLNPKNLVKEEIEIDNTKTLTIETAENGGFVMKID